MKCLYIIAAIFQLTVSIIFNNFKIYFIVTNIAMKAFVPKNMKNNEKNNGILYKKQESEKIINTVNPINPIFIPTQFFINPLPKTSKNVFNKYLKNKNIKPFVERTGDWICKKCQNLNFSFRNKCNRCGLEKTEENNDIKRNDEKTDENENSDKDKKYMNQSFVSDFNKSNGIEDSINNKNEKNVIGID